MAPVQAAREMIEEVGQVRPWALVAIMSISGLFGGGVSAIPQALTSGQWVTSSEFQGYKERSAERQASRDTEIALIRQQLDTMNGQLKSLIESQVKYQDRMQSEVANLIRTVDGRLPARKP